MVRTLGSAFLESKSVTRLLLPALTAACKAVLPVGVARFTSAPRASNSSATALKFFSTAAISAVGPFVPAAFTSAAVQQEFHDAEVAAFRRQHQRRHTAVGPIQIHALRENELGDRWGTFTRGVLERSEAVLVRRVQQVRLFCASAFTRASSSASAEVSVGAAAVPASASAPAPGSMPRASFTNGSYSEKSRTMRS